MAYDGVVDSKKIGDLCRRVTELKAANADNLLEQEKIRAVLNGGPEAVRALLGPKADPNNAPFANFLLASVDKLAQKLGRVPDIKKEPAATADSETAAKRAEKIARIVETYDDVCKLPNLLPQLGRWLPGYGYAAMTVQQSNRRVDGTDPYPTLELRDPYGTFPGEWGPGQQPRDVGFCRIIQAKTLAGLFPEFRERILGKDRQSDSTILLDVPSWGAGRGSWANQAGAGLEVYEYLDADGTWWVVPQKGLLLSYTPNMCKRPLFYIGKRFAFDRLTGQYSQLLGVLSGIARMSLLLLIATEDSVMSEINVYGDTAQGDRYKLGRNQVNWMTQGTKVEKPNSHVPFEAFQYLQTFERQLRVGASYPVQDDGNSPMSFATGRGINELSAASDQMVREYQTVIADMLMELDATRLEFDETMYPDRTKQMAGTRAGTPFSESYTPRVHIKGDYRTRRLFGAMAGFDEPTKIITGLQLLTAGVIDMRTMRENIDGLGNHTKIAENIWDEQVQKALLENLLARSQQGDERAMRALIGMLPDGENKTLLAEQYLQPAQEAAPVNEGVPGAPGVPGPADLEGLLGQLGSGSAPAGPAALPAGPAPAMQVA